MVAFANKIVYWSTMEPAKISVLGSHYSCVTRSAVHSTLLEAAKAGQKGYVCVSNVHTTMTGVFEPGYQSITNSAFLAVPDGVPLVWAMRSLGATKQDRVRGPSLMRDLFDLGRLHGIKHYLYGGSPEAIAKLKETLLRAYPGALIVGAESPPFRPLEAITEREWQESAERINRSGAHFVWVGLGAPKQEKWMWQQRGRVNGIMFGIGAAFDLIPGIVPEAPAPLQKLGMEWAYRLFREPRRLWKRYLFNNPAFLVLWAGQVVARVFGRDFFRYQRS
jgi:N-acetylglucosaminyldiphosphoundecaprenol N-acetyl-beta-D-mannosaminyltransferase